MIMDITFNTVTVYNTFVMPICLCEKCTHPIGLLPQGNLVYHFMPTENIYEQKKQIWITIFIDIVYNGVT